MSDGPPTPATSEEQRLAREPEVADLAEARPLSLMASLQRNRVQRGGITV